MKLKPSLVLLFIAFLIVSLSIVFVPGPAESIESWMLGFLAGNAAV